MARSKIIAFVSSEDYLGMASILSDLAEALVALDDADYLLVDIPFKPTPLTRSVLAGCDLVMVASSCKLDYIDGTKNVIKELLFLGIAPERTAALLIDPEGILPGASLAGIKAYLETNLGIEMAGGISFDADARGTDSRLPQEILQVAQYIVAHGRRAPEPVTQSL